MLKGIFLGAVGLCIAVAMLVAAIMPQTLSNIYYGIVGDGIQLTAETPQGLLQLSQPMPVAIDVANNATSDRIYRNCPGLYPARPRVRTQAGVDMPFASQWASYFDKGPDKAQCLDVTLKTGQHQMVTVDLHDLFDLRDPGDYHFGIDTGDANHSPDIVLHVAP